MASRSSLEKMIALEDCNSDFKAPISGTHLTLPENSFNALLLPSIAARRGFDDAVFDAVKKFRAMRVQPGQNIPGQLSVVGAGLDDFEGRVACCVLRVWCPIAAFKPVSELERQQFAEQLRRR